MNQATTVSPEQLAQELIDAKAAEARANKQRVAIEEQIVQLFGVRAEGSQTHELANGLKVVITGKQSYKADLELLMRLCNVLPANLRPLKTETKLDETGAKFLRANDPEVWALLSPAITVKPAKTAVEIKA
jgi:hypothetical protein